MTQMIDMFDQHGTLIDTMLNEILSESLLRMLMIFHSLLMPSNMCTAGNAVEEKL